MKISCYTVYGTNSLVECDNCVLTLKYSAICSFEQLLVCFLSPTVNIESDEVVKELVQHQTHTLLLANPLE